jgi:hypothetical protein
MPCNVICTNPHAASQYNPHGETEVMVELPVTVKLTLFVALESATAVAVTAAVIFVLITAAVKTPVEALIVPAAAGVAVHVTEMSDDPVTTATKSISLPAPVVLGTGFGSVISRETTGGGTMI